MTRPNRPSQRHRRRLLRRVRIMLVERCHGCRRKLDARFVRFHDHYVCSRCAGLQD
jgi:hypothetical protein